MHRLRTAGTDGNRRAFSAQGSLVPIRDISLPGGDDRPFTPPVPSGNPVHPARSESFAISIPERVRHLPSPHPPRRCAPRAHRVRNALNRLCVVPPRRLTDERNGALSSCFPPLSTSPPRAPVPDPPQRFLAITRLPNLPNVEPSPPLVMYWSKTFCVGRAPYSPVWGNTLLPLRSMWLENLVAAMTMGVQRHVVLQYRCVLTPKLPLPNDIDLVPHRRDDTTDASQDAAGPSATISRSLGDSCWSRDCHKLITDGSENALCCYSVHVFDIPIRRWSRTTLTTTDVLRPDGPTRRCYTRTGSECSVAEIGYTR